MKERRRKRDSITLNECLPGQKTCLDVVTAQIPVVLIIFPTLLSVFECSMLIPSHVPLPCRARKKQQLFRVAAGN